MEDSDKLQISKIRKKERKKQWLHLSFQKLYRIISIKILDNPKLKKYVTQYM